MFPPFHSSDYFKNPLFWWILVHLNSSVPLNFLSFFSSELTISVHRFVPQCFLSLLIPLGLSQTAQCLLTIHVHPVPEGQYISATSISKSFQPLSITDHSSQQWILLNTLEYLQFHYPVFLWEQNVEAESKRKER